MNTEITSIPIDHLRESPSNPRKSYPEAALQELAESIKAQGIIEPIIVRLAPNRPGDQRNLQVTHEIVAGHRRYRASILAQRATIPAIVRELTDAQAAVMQIHENLHREDVSPIEEADGFLQLQSNHGVGVDEIVASSMKSRSYVYARLRLAKAAEELRQAVVAEGLGSEIAQRIARYPSPKLQVKALAQMRETEYVDNAWRFVGWVSDRQAKRVLKTFTIPLQDASFALDDPTLCPTAGACTTCPNRAGNDPDLAELDADTCLDGECYAQKKASHAAKTIAAARKAGREVIEGERAAELMPHTWSHAPEGYMRLDSGAFSEVDPADPDRYRSVSVAEALERLGKKAPKASLVVNPHKSGDLFECLPTDQVKAIVEKLAPRGQDDDEGDHDGDDDDGHDARAPLSPEQTALFQDWGRLQEAAMQAACARKQRTGYEMLMVARALLQDSYDIADSIVAGMGWQAEIEVARELPDFRGDEVWGMSRLARAEPWEVAQFCVLWAIYRAPIEYGYQGEPEKREILAEYGVPILAPVEPESAGEVQAPAQDASTPSPAARAPKKAKAAPAQKKPKRPLKLSDDQAPDDAGLAGEDQTDDAGVAGKPADIERDPNTSDMFEGVAG